MYGDHAVWRICTVCEYVGSEWLKYNSALLARLKVEFPSKYTVVSGLPNGTVLGVLKNLLKRVCMFQIELEHCKIFKVFIA